jgi:hypothetical protein
MSTKFKFAGADESAAADEAGWTIVNDHATDAASGVPYPETETRPIPLPDPTIAKFGSQRHNVIFSAVANEIANRNAPASVSHVMHATDEAESSQTHGR